MPTIITKLKKHQPNSAPALKQNTLPTALSLKICSIRETRRQKRGKLYTQKKQFRTKSKVWKKKYEGLKCQVDSRKQYKIIFYNFNGLF